MERGLVRGDGFCGQSGVPGPAWPSPCSVPSVPCVSCHSPLTNTSGPEKAYHTPPQGRSASVCALLYARRPLDRV